MATLIVDRQTSMDTLLSFVGAGKIKLSAEGAWTPVADEGGAVAPTSERQAKIRAIFDRCRVDLTDFKFDRDEANNYE